MMIGNAKPIGVHLLLLSAMLLAPMIALAGYIVVEYARSEQQRLERFGLETANQIAASVDREHSELLTVLQTLRTDPSLAGGDLAEFHKTSSVLSTLGIDVVLRSMDGQVLLHSRIPWGTAPPTTTDPESIAEIRKSKQSFVSNIFFGAVSNNPSFNVTLPVLVDGEVAYALSTSSDANMIQRAIDSKVTTAQLAIILDRSGTVVARSHDPQAFAGRKLPEAFLSKVHGPESMFREDSGDLGVMQWQRAHTKIANWPLVVGTPVALLEAPLYRALSLIGALSMLALALGIFAARLFSVRITQAVQALSRHASMLEAGENMATLLTPVAEVNTVSSKIARAASRLQMSEERLNVALAGAHAGVWDWDIRGATIEGDFYPFDRTRAKPGRISFDSWINLIHPDDRERALETFNIATRTKSDYVDEYRVLGPEPGEIRWIASRGQVLFDLDGEPIRVTGINFDITERKSNEQHIEFTMRELSHRAKNLLAVVQAMARQTARQSGTFEDFEVRFSGRIQALSHAHDLLVRQDWRGVPMRDLIHSQLEAFTDVNQRVSIEGPIVTLNPQAAQHFALALHELATNASKYGALSVPAGRVAIRWSLKDNAPDRKFLFEWAEHGGPKVESSKRRGFGTFVVERMASSGMGGDATLLFDPGGIRWRLEAPDSQVLRK